MNKTVKKPTKLINQDSLIEQLKSLGSNVTSSIKSDLVSQVGSDALSSLFGIPKQGEMSPGKPLQLGDQKLSQVQEKPEPILSKSRKPENMINQLSNESLNQLKQHEAAVSQKIEEIRIELRALIAAIKNVDKEIETAATANYVNSGIYHLEFLDRLKTILKVMRQNLNNSSTWLNCMKSRKRERSFWNMYKKKGTSFGLSNERSVASQVG